MILLVFLGILLLQLECVGTRFFVTVVLLSSQQSRTDTILKSQFGMGLRMKEISAHYQTAECTLNTEDMTLTVKWYGMHKQTHTSVPDVVYPAVTIV